MKSGFMRCVFGDSPRTQKIHEEIALYSGERFKPEPHRVLCWGQANFDAVVRSGFNAVLVSSSPWHSPTAFEQHGRHLHFKDGNSLAAFWHHKLIALDLAFEHFDEFIYLDWDVTQRKSLPPNFWDRLRQKEPLQGSLYVYSRRQVTWKENDQRKLVSAGFLYLRERSIAKKLLELAAKYPQWREEQIITFYLDMVLGHFPHTQDQDNNARVFAEKHEPFCFESTRPMTTINGDRKDIIFVMESVVHRYRERFRVATK